MFCWCTRFQMERANGRLRRTFKIVEIQRRSLLREIFSRHATRIHSDLYFTYEQTRRFVHTATLAALHSTGQSLVSSGIKDNLFSGGIDSTTICVNLSQ
jgi:hypothetical protein